MIRALAPILALTFGAAPALAEEAVVSYRVEKGDPVMERIHATFGDGEQMIVETFRQPVVVTLTFRNDVPLTEEDWSEVHARVHVCDKGHLSELDAETLENGVRWTFDCIWAADE